MWIWRRGFAPWLMPRWPTGLRLGAQGYRRRGGTAAVLALMSGPISPSSVEERAVALPEFAECSSSGANLTALSRLFI